MSESGHPVLPFGPFLGVMEDNCDERHVEDALNVHFDGGRISRRMGRSLLTAAPMFRPLECWTLDGNVSHLDSGTDITAALTDGNLSTVATSLFRYTTSYLLVGVSVQFTGLEWRTYAGQVAAANMSVEYWSPSTGWTAVPTFTDGTAAGGVPFSIGTTGQMTWGLPSDWVKGNNNSIRLSNQDLFWVRISASAGLTFAWTAAELRAGLLKAGIDLDSEVNGLYDFEMRTGGRRVVVCKDFPGRFVHTSTMVQARAVARVFYLDMAANELVPLPLPDAAQTSEPGASYSFVTMNGQMLFTNGIGAVCRYDGKECAVLEALPGEDANPSLTTNPRAYLASVPRGRYMAVYRNRLAIAGNRFAPNTVQLSESDDFLNNIPARAKVGGANVWPVDQNFDCVSQENDEVTGITVLHDRLVVLKRRSVYLYDEISLRQVSQNLGCVAPRSLVNVGSQIFFLSEQGVVSFDGSRFRIVSGTEADKPSNVGRTVREKLDRFAAWGSVAVNYRKRREYRLFVPVNGFPMNRLCLCFNYGNERWEKHATRPIWVRSDDVPDYPDYTSAIASVQYGDVDEALLVGDYAGRLYLDDVGHTDGGSPIVALFVTPEIRAAEERATAWRALRVRAAATGADLRVVQLADGCSHRFVLGEVDATLRDNEGDAVRWLRRHDVPGSGGAQPPIAKGTAGNYSRLTDYKFPLRSVGRHMRYLFFSTGRSRYEDATGIVKTDKPLPWSVKSFALIVEPKEGRRK